MKFVYTQILRDDVFRSHLEYGDSLIFKGTGKTWQEIEDQVERFGFGDAYAVSRTRRSGATGEQDVIRISPVHTPQAG